MADGRVTLDILIMVKDRRIKSLRKEIDEQEKMIRQAALLEDRWAFIRSMIEHMDDDRLRISELQGLFQTAEYEVTRQKLLAEVQEKPG